jgi:hypothetical protein
MPNGRELVFEYDDTSFVVTATGSRRGEKMPHSHPSATLSADLVKWFARRFIEHKKQRHTSEVGTDN